MPRLTATLALATLLLTAACADSDTSDDPDLLVAAAASFQQVACEPVPLQLINTRTGETRLGPTERYVTLALSPTADRVAAARMDWDLCGPDGPTQPETFTLFLLDVATLEVTELLTSERTIAYLHWSPDGRYLALVGIHDVVLYDLAAKNQVAVGARENTLVKDRSLLAWTDAGPYVFLYSAGARLFGLSPDPTYPLAKWTFDCPGGAAGYISRVQPPSTKHVSIDYHCDNVDQQPSLRLQMTLDLLEGSLSKPSPSDAYMEWLNELFTAQDLAREQFPGAVATTYYGADTTGQLRILAITYLPNGDDLLTLSGSEEGYPTNTETQIAIERPNGEILYLRVDITSTDLDYGMGPLHDVAILPD